MSGLIGSDWAGFGMVNVKNSENSEDDWLALKCVWILYRIWEKGEIMGFGGAFVVYGREL
jgi:hypothetical protein